ncbi:hypothetical protein niasHT_024697 [Heterodera trifolii]|uniref:Uncharacterized protein n=1 Tax=Heterodera trifolii TaxID=157864 RepID=A0ABD2JUZ0_9BILA
MVPQMEGTFKIVEGQSKSKEVKEGCNPERDCKQCGGLYSCIPIPEVWMTYSGCCGPGYEMKCCVTTTSTTTTTTTTTTTITTTTTTDEFLRCKKATFESNPAGNIYNEQEDKACSLAERHCYVLNCTTISSSYKGYVGFKTVWGCSVKKESFYDDYKKRNNLLESPSFKSTCNYFVGKKNKDMSNLNKEVPIFNASITTHWCKGGHFWNTHNYGDNMTFCKPNEHYCYVLNCTIVLTVNKDNHQSEIITEWGCTEREYDTDDFIQGKGRDFAKAYIGTIPNNSLCVSTVVRGSTDGIIMPAPTAPKKCKIGRVAFGNKTSNGECGPDTNACYFISCEDSKDPKRNVKEWGCTSNLELSCAQKKVELGFESTPKECECHGLICKSGYSFIRNDYGFKDQIGNRTCPDTVDYCAAITCTKAGLNGLSAIFWACASMDMKESKEKWFEDYYVKNLSVPNVHCHAEFGEKHKDFGNTHFKRPRVPDGLLCFAGEEFIKLDFCEDDDHFCYLAKCTKDTKQWKTKLGCSPYDSCGFITDAEEKNATGSTVNCNCKFGGKDVTKSNGEFTLEDVDFPTPMLTTKRKRKNEKHQQHHDDDNEYHDGKSVDDPRPNNDHGDDE